MIREFDERGGCLKWGLDSTSKWLAWRCDLSMATAREKVRVAQALKHLPLISATFATGELSYSKVRSLTRVANVDSEEDLVAFALRNTASHVAEYCRELRMGSPLSAEKEYLQGSETNETKKSSDNYLVNIHVDQSALAGDIGRSSVPIETVKRLCCDGKTVVMTETKDGEPLSIGRKSRVVPKGIERAVRARDKNTCRFPGCCNQRFVDIHHIEHWANGGETAVDQLMLLCSKHHTLVHEGGFRIEKDFQDHWSFFRPDGIAVPDCGYHSRDMLDESIVYEDQGERYDDPPRGGLLSAVEKLVNEPPPPRYYH